CLTLSTSCLCNLEPCNSNPTSPLQQDILIFSTILSHRPHPINRHPSRHTRNGQGRRLLIIQIIRCPHEALRRECAMRRQHTVQRQPEPSRKFFLGDLASQVVREESREDTIAGFPGGYSVADLSDDSAHVRAGDDSVILADG